MPTTEDLEQLATNVTLAQAALTEAVAQLLACEVIIQGGGPAPPPEGAATTEAEPKTTAEIVCMTADMLDTSGETAKAIQKALKG